MYMYIYTEREREREREREQPGPASHPVRPGRLGPAGLARAAFPAPEAVFALRATCVGAAPGDRAG